jgi:pre-mRNA-processing factor 19
MVVVCSISGYPPEEPVISKDGYIFERRLIERIISETGHCPITNAPLSVEDLRPVHSSSPNTAVPVDSSSLPGLIEMLQKEWDRLLIESYELKSQLGAAKEELAKLVYENEAAVRTIARLTRERDQALSELGGNQQQ